MEMPCCSLKSSFPLSISKNVFVLHVWCQKHYTALSNSQLFSELLVDWWLPVVAGSIWTFVEQRRSSDLLSCRTMQTWGRRSHSKVLEALVSVDTAAVDIIEPDADQSEQILISRSAQQPDESPPLSDCFLYVYLIRASLSLNHTLPWLIFIPQPFDADMMESDTKPLARLLLLLPLSSRQWQHLGSAQKVKISLRPRSDLTHLYRSDIWCHKSWMG